MNLHQMIFAMRNEARHHNAALADARTREEALAGFASISALLAALPVKEEQTPEEKHALTSAMLREHARGGSRLWSSLLVIAFEPMLVAQCGRAASLPSGEREQTVLAAFLEAVRTGTTHEYLRSAPAYLKTSTQLNVVHELSCRQMGADDPSVEVIEYDEDRTVSDPRDVFESPVERLAAAREEFEQAAARSAGLTPRDIAEALLSTDRNARRRARRLLLTPAGRRARRVRERPSPFAASRLQ
jgi:hypothetical protein